jgi:NADH-quinone oxidoreductase subunit C
VDVRTPVQTIYGDHAAKFSETWAHQIKQLREKFGGAVLEVKMPRETATDVPVIFLKKESAIEILAYIKNTTGFEYDFLSDITATDESPDTERFHVVYQLFSHVNFCRIRIKVKLRDGEEMPTLINVWAGANWAEREIWDMFGVKFSGHPDLRRILMDDRWVGHPLRKDYPLRGYQIFPTPETIDPKLLE